MLTLRKLMLLLLVVMRAFACPFLQKGIRKPKSLILMVSSKFLRTPYFSPFFNFLEGSEFFQYSPGSKSSSSSSQSTSTTANGRTDSSDSEYDERVRGSPHTPRKRKVRQHKRHGNGNDRNTLTTTSNDGSDALDELAYVDTLPEVLLVVNCTLVWSF